MAELVRGSVADRPWGRTFAAFALRGITGQLTLSAEGKKFHVVFDHGAVVAAASPLASDAAVRVALTAHLISSSQVPEISRRQAQAPERDEIDVIAELARLGPEHALRLRRRAIAQRAARTFAVPHGEFFVTDRPELPVVAGCALDVRAIIYIGARTNLAEQRLSAELAQLGSWFRLKPGIDDDLPQYGFTDVEQPVIERLRDGGTLRDLESFAASFVDARTVRAAVYALAVYNACDIDRGATGSSISNVPAAPSPQLRPKPPTQPIPRPTPSPTPPQADASRPKPTPGPLSRGPAVPMAAATDVAANRTRPMQTGLRPPAAPSPPAQPGRPLAAGSATSWSADDNLEIPAERDASEPPRRSPRPPGSPGLDAPLKPPGSDPALRLPRTGSHVAIRLPSDSDTRQPARTGSDVAIRLPPDAAAESTRRPRETQSPRTGSDAALRLPPDDAVASALPAPAGPSIRRRVISSSQPPITREVKRTASAKSHEVKSLIAQRLKLLDNSDHFQLLGVPRDATEEAIRRAYFTLARQLHPDRLAALGISDDGKHAQRLFAEINAGFAVLSDADKRAEYLSVLQKGGEGAVRAEQARAEELTRRILEAEEAYRRAEQALRRDDPRAAVSELEHAIQLHPDEVDYLALLAWARFCAASDKAAIAGPTRTALDKAIQRAPQAVSARFFLGRVERMLGRDPEALRHFREVIAAAPNHAEAAAEIRALEMRSKKR